MGQLKLDYYCSWKNKNCDIYMDDGYVLFSLIVLTSSSGGVIMNVYVYAGAVLSMAIRMMMVFLD